MNLTSSNLSNTISPEDRKLEPKQMPIWLDDSVIYFNCSFSVCFVFCCFFFIFFISKICNIVWSSGEFKNKSFILFYVIVKFSDYIYVLKIGFHNGHNTTEHCDIIIYFVYSNSWSDINSKLIPPIVWNNRAKIKQILFPFSFKFWIENLLQNHFCPFQKENVFLFLYEMMYKKKKRQSKHSQLFIWFASLSLSLSIYLSIYLSICLSNC